MGDYKLMEEGAPRRSRSPALRRSLTDIRELETLVEKSKAPVRGACGRRGSFVETFFHTAGSVEEKKLEVKRKKRQSMPDFSPAKMLQTTSRRSGRAALPHRHSDYELSIEQADNLRSILNRMVLLPSSPFLMYWDTFVFGGLVITGLFEPCLLVFEQLDGVPSLIIGLVLSLFFMLDTLLRCFRAKKVTTREGVALVTYLPELFRRYRNSKLIFDLLSALPFALLALVDSDSRTLRFVRITFPMLRFVRLPRLMMHLQEVTRWSFSAINILEFVLMSFLVLHWIACVWALLGTSGTTSWLSQAKQNYVFLEKDNFSEGRVYLVALYWSVTVLTSVGFGDITPQSWSEFIVATICMSIGGGVWAYVVGSVCGMASAIDKHKNAFESQMNDVSVLLQERNLPMKLQERVREFYKHAQDFMRMKMYHDTIRELSPTLKGEVISWMYGSCFRRVWYFDVVDEDDKCKLVLVEGLIPVMYAPEECIEDNVGNERALVFLRSGLCIRKSNLLAPGAVWGLDVILGSEEHEDIEELLDHELARSINFVFVLKLGKHHIDHAASLHPNFARRLRKAHCRMLLWRGVIAASRAEKRLHETKNTQMQTHVSNWDRLGKLMGQVVHRDRLLLEDQNDPLHPHGHIHHHHDHFSPMNRRARRLSNFSQNFGVSDLTKYDRQISDEPMQTSERQAPGELRATADWRLPKHRSPPKPSSCSLSAAPLPHRRLRSLELNQPSDDHPANMEIPTFSLDRMDEISLVKMEDCKADSQKAGSDDQSLSEVSEESEVVEMLSSWRMDVKKSLDAQANELEEFQAEVQDDISALGEEVEELSRLMHQLLARLDAEEKY